MICGRNHSETTVTGCSDALINMCSSFFDQVFLSFIDVKFLQCIKISSRSQAHNTRREGLAGGAFWGDEAGMALRLLPGVRLVAATHNPGKARELDALLDGRFDVVTAGALGLPEPDETEQTFAGNALLKARAAANASGMIALADDSGLSVAALDGAPGIFSARWAGPARDFGHAMRLVEQRLAEADDRNPAAWFTSALAVAWPDGPAVVVEGRVDGALTFPPRGDKGFGYDPIFMAAGETLTFGELDPMRKETMSHRTRAFAKLKAALID
jgi:XTP/dITP diphosphohydrolase